MASSTLHQSNPSPLQTTKCHQGYFPDVSALTTAGLCGLEEINYHLLHGEDFVVPQTNLIFSDDHHHQHDEGFELPALPNCNAVDYFSCGGLDGLMSFDSSAGYPQMNATIHGYISTPNCSPSTYPLAANGGIWGLQGNQSQKTSQGDNITRVGRYSVEERRDRILRYLKKRNQRNFTKTIKYACRKTLADRRARVRGRFAKNNEEVSDDHFKPHKNSPVNNEEIIISPCSYYDYANYDHQVVIDLQKKEQGEEWLQEAIASLMYNMAAPYHVPQWQASGGHLLQ